MSPLFIALAVIAYVGCAAVIGLIGRKRTMGGWGYFFGSIVLTPVIGLILLFASGPRKQPERN